MVEPLKLHYMVDFIVQSGISGGFEGSYLH